MIGACVVDSDYQGEIHLHLINVGNEPKRISPGDKIVQFLLIEVDHDIVEEVREEDLFDYTSTRATGGFGSTGIMWYYAKTYY